MSRVAQARAYRIQAGRAAGRRPLADFRGFRPGRDARSLNRARACGGPTARPGTGAGHGDGPPWAEPLTADSDAAPAATAQAEGMTDEGKIPQFGAEARRELFHQRVLVLDGPLDDDNGTLIATQLLALAAADEASDIALWIHSPGGSVPSMLAIRDVMRLIPNDVATLALGLACSAGQFLLSAGTPGKRRALPHARILMHQGSSGIGGSTVEVEVQADDLRHTRDTVLGLIAADTGQSLERVFEDSLHDRWYTAAEARDYGFIDGIVDDFAQVVPRRRRPAGLGVPAERTNEVAA
jgi:ATP-dependent Clp protease protease subunit